MAAAATQNPQVKLESKSAKKKKAKVASGDVEPVTTTSAEAPSNGAPESNNGDGSYESPYIKELYKSIRNVNKKIANASKVDSIVAANPDKTLDQLINERTINADQKAQILKKPGLKKQLEQLEEQIAQYKKFDQEYKAVSQAEKAAFEKAHTDRTSKELAEAVAAAKAEFAVSAEKEQEANLLLLSQFLYLAALRRGAEQESNEDEKHENAAIEGLLSKIYLGDANGVAYMLQLIKGSSDLVEAESSSDDLPPITYAHIKTVTLAQHPASSIIDESVETSEETPAVKTTEYPVESDPTIANVALTEIDDAAATVQVNGHSDASTEVQGIPQNSGFGEGGNAAAQENWDNNNDLSQSQEWVEVPRDATETETGLTATPVAPSNVQSWADDQPDSPTETTTAPASKDDGFHEVQSKRGGNRENRGGQGQGPRGGRGRGDGRGRGFFGGRGRGGRGGAPRGGRRSDES